MSDIVYLCTNLASGSSEIIDILAAYQESVPPVLHTDVTGTINYSVQGSHDRTRWHTYFTGTAAAEKNLVVGVRFWKILVNSGTGSVTAAVGPVPDRNGQQVVPVIYNPYVQPVP